MAPKPGWSGGIISHYHDTPSLTPPCADADLNLTLISSISHLATTASDPRLALEQIKQLIHNSGTLDPRARGFKSARSSPSPPLHVPPLISMGPSVHDHDGSLSPPITNADSLSDSVYLSEVDLTSSITKSSSRRSDLDSSDRNMPPSVTMRDVPRPGGGRNDDDDDDDDDNDNEEFSLEEELEGIADAPVHERAALRKALREKQQALTRQMRQVSSDKQRIARIEALQIKKTFFNGETDITSGSGTSRSQQTQAPTVPAQVPAVRHSQKSTTTTATATATGGTKITDTSSTNTAQSAVNSASAQPDPAVNSTSAQPDPAEKLVLINDNDENGELKFRPVNSTARRPRPNHAADTNLTSPIISLDTIGSKKSSHFGISFDPSKIDEATADRISGTTGSKDTRRSVLIQCIPPETTIHELLAYIRGGTIVSAKLVPDPKNGGDSQVAIVTFGTAKEAHACTELSASILSRSDLASKLRVGLLPTASYPAGEVLSGTSVGYLGLSTAEQPTRCLSIGNFPKYLIDELCTELHLSTSRLPDKMHVLEEMWFAQDTLVIHFTSIQEAKKAHGILTFLHYGKYRNDVHYLPDPCANTCFDLTATGTIKLASHGHQGLKSLLQTVGLATYARNQEKLYLQKISSTDTAERAPFCLSRGTATAVPVRAPSLSPSSTRSGKSRTALSSGPSMSSDTASLLMSINSGMFGTENIEAHQVASHAEVSPAMDSTPWTENLMVGLDKL